MVEWEGGIWTVIEGIIIRVVQNVDRVSEIFVHLRAIVVVSASFYLVSLSYGNWKVHLQIKCETFIYAGKEQI